MKVNRKQRNRIEIDLFAVFSTFWKKKYLILIFCGLGAVIIFLATLLFVTPKYSSYITMYANNSNSSDKNTSISSQDINASVQLVDTYAAIILSDPILDQVIQQNNLEMTSSELLECISVTSVNNTEVFKVTVESISPITSTNIANTIANIAPDKISDIVDGCSVKIISYAKTPSEQSSPNYKHSILIGFAMGLLIGLIVVFINSVMDTRIKHESDFEQWDYPVLGVIPSFSEAQKGGVYAASSKGGYR